MDTLHRARRLALVVAKEPLRLSVYKQSGRPRGNGHSCVGKLFKRLALQEASRHTKRAKGPTQQHYSCATIRNPRNAWAKKRPPGKAIRLASWPFGKCSSWNCDDSTQITDVPNFRSGVGTVVLRKQVRI